MSLLARTQRHTIPAKDTVAVAESNDDLWLRLQTEFRALTAEVREYLSSLPDRASMSDDWLRTQAESELNRLFKNPRYEVATQDDELFLLSCSHRRYILGFAHTRPCSTTPVSRRSW